MNLKDKVSLINSEQLNISLSKTFHKTIIEVLDNAKVDFNNIMSIEFLDCSITKEHNSNIYLKNLIVRVTTIEGVQDFNDSWSTSYLLFEKLYSFDVNAKPYLDIMKSLIIDLLEQQMASDIAVFSEGEF